MSLTDEQQRRIEEEQRFRAEARLRAEQEARTKVEKQKNQAALGCIGAIIILIIIGVLPFLGVLPFPPSDGDNSKNSSIPSSGAPTASRQQEFAPPAAEDPVETNLRILDDELASFGGTRSEGTGTPVSETLSTADAAAGACLIGGTPWCGMATAQWELAASALAMISQASDRVYKQSQGEAGGRLLTEAQQGRWQHVREALCQSLEPRIRRIAHKVHRIHALGLEQVPRDDREKQRIDERRHKMAEDVNRLERTCRGEGPGVDLNAVRNATYNCGDLGDITLHDGHWKEGDDEVNLIQGGPAIPTQRIPARPDEVAFGDLNGDGRQDAVVGLVYHPRLANGSWGFQYILLDNGHGWPLCLGAVQTGEGAFTFSLRIENGVVLAHRQIHTKDDTTHGPSLLVVVKYLLTRSRGNAEIEVQGIPPNGVIYDLGGNEGLGYGISEREAEAINAITRLDKQLRPLLKEVDRLDSMSKECVRGNASLCLALRGQAERFNQDFVRLTALTRKLGARFNASAPASEHMPDYIANEWELAVMQGGLIQSAVQEIANRLNAAARGEHFAEPSERGCAEALRKNQAGGVTLFDRVWETFICCEAAEGEAAADRCRQIWQSERFDRCYDNCPHGSLEDWRCVARCVEGVG